MKESVADVSKTSVTGFFIGYQSLIYKVFKNNCKNFVIKG